MKQYLTNEPLIVNEELQVYIKDFKRAKNLKIKEITYPRVLMDKLLIAMAVRQGVTNQLFNEIKTNSPFSDLQWSVFLNINIRTLQRYNIEKSHVYKPMQSERIFELAEVISKGNSVFDEAGHFQIWLNTPSLALGKEKPINLLDSSYGKDLVLAELNRIEFGIFI